MSSVSATYFAEVPSRPDYIIVSSRQRSSSTTLTSVLGSHPCVISGNEIWTDNPVQDRLDAHSMVNMTSKEISENPDLFLQKAHGLICQKSNLPEMCGGNCTIAIKMFDEHKLSYTGIKSLMNNRNNFFVVLERDVRGEYCSYHKAQMTGDWGVTPQGHKKSTEHFKCGVIDRTFESKHNTWFSMLTTNLKEMGRFFISVPFSMVASCELKNVVNSIFSATGQPMPAPLQLKGERFFLNGEMENLFKKCEK